MKEIIRQTLANSSQTPYSKGGDLLMAEKNQDMVPKNSQPTNPNPQNPEGEAGATKFWEEQLRQADSRRLEQAEQPAAAGEAPRISSEQIETARTEWESRNNARRAKGEDISVDELHSQEMAWRQGAKPDLTQEAKFFLETVDEGGIPTSVTNNLGRILRENGISDEDIQTKTPNELIGILRGKSPVATTQNTGPESTSTGNANRGGAQTTPETSASGSGANVPPGREPPRAPPVSPSEGNSGDEGEKGDGKKSVFRIDTEHFGITNEPLLNLIRGAEEGVRYAGSDEEAYNALLESLKNIHALPSKEDPSGQKILATEAIREQLNKIFQKRAESAQKALSQDERAQMRDQIESLRETIVGSLSDNEKMDKIEKLIESIDLNDRAYPHIITEAIKGIENEGVDYLVEDMLEYSLERFLNRADATPDQDYPQFTFTESENIAVITNTARRFDEARRLKGIQLGIEPGRREMFQYLTTLNNRRRVMHELFRSMNDLESFTGLITKALRKSGMSFVEKQLVGVKDVQIVYDQVLLFLKSMKPQEKGWLLEEDFVIGDKMVKEQLMESMQEYPENFFRSFIKNDGALEQRPLRKWEIDRAFHMGRDLSGASQRRVIYGILGDIPENADEFLKSVVHEPIARRLAPLKLIPDRFFSHGIAKRFISIFKNEQKRDIDGKISDTKYGYIAKDKNGKTIYGKDGKPLKRGLFGSSQDDFAILDIGIVDPKSNSWRSRWLFIKNPRFKNRETSVDGVSATIGDYLDATKKKFTEGKNHHERKHAIEEWNNSIRDVISHQRLVLGVLIRYPDLDSANKTIIWKNVAKHMPSRIGSLFPNETLELVDDQFNLGGNREKAVTQWTNIAKKLWTAERMRGKNDDRVLGGEGGVLQDTDSYFDKVGLTVDEKKLAKRITALGEKFAPTLSGIKFPFTVFLDDAPETNWDGLSDFDFTRILVNDQNAFQEGYGHLMGNFDNPVKKPEEVAKVIIEAFEKIKSPPGVPDTQKIFEPIVKATVKMRQMNRRAKWMGATLARMLRIPTSPIEEYNLQAHVADDEHDTMGMLHALSQHDVLADDPNELDEKGRTQYQRYREDLDVDTEEVMLAYVRLIIQLFGPAFGLEFAKALGLKMPS